MQVIDILILIPVFFLCKELIYIRNRRKVSGMPGIVQFAPFFTIILNFLPKEIFGFKLFPYRFDWPWVFPYSDIYKKYGRDIVSFTHALGTDVYTADADIIKQITSNRVVYPKPIRLYGILDLFGKNVVTTEDEEWKRHRKVTAPGFTEKNNKLVHEQTLKLCQEMTEAWEAQGEAKAALTVDVVKDFTKLTLYIISAAGFGVNIPWEESDHVPPGHEIPFYKCIEIVSLNTKPRLFLPKWAFKMLPIPKLKEIDLGFEEFEKYMIEMIEAAKNAGSTGETGDLVHSLVSAGLGDAGEPLMEYSELVGNTFILLFAGHETTAHTLMFAFALLALYPDVQEKLYRSVQEVLGERCPNYEDFNTLEFPMAVFQEALRLYPPVIVVPKCAGEDVELGGYHVKAGTFLNLHVAALHRNPKYWKNPDEFYPERWLGENAKEINKNAFIPFSDGARSCLGKRFAQIEAVCIIATLIQKYRVTPVDPGVAKEELLKAQNVITLTPKHDLQLKFVPRMLNK